MNNGIRIRNIEPQEITIEGATTVAGITNVYVNGVDVTVGTKAYVIVPTKTSELTNDSGFITSYTETDPTVPAYVKAISLADINSWNDKQNLLVSGTNIKTINGNSILGSGNLEVTNNYTAGYGIKIDVDNVISNTITSYQDLTDLPTIPNKTSDLINDSGFINKTVNDLTNYIRADLLEELFPSVSDSGTELYLQDTIPYNLHLKLNPSEIGQTTLNGYNLFDMNLLQSTEKNNVTLIKNDDGTITLNGTASADANFDFYITSITADSSYKLQLYNQSGSYSGNYVSVYMATDNTWGNFDMLSITTNPITSMSLGSKTYTYARVKVNTGVTCTNFKIGVQVVDDSSITTFEPYTGGFPSPNPDYPQVIHTITGENSVTIGNKNLLNITDETYTSNGITVTISNGTLTINGTASSTTFIDIIYPLNLKIGSYTISANNPVAYSNTNVDIRVTNSNGSIIARNYLNSINASLSFTINTDLINGRFQLRTGSGETLNNFIIKPQLEHGSTATSYVPHEERTDLLDLTSNDIELTKISTQWGDYENFLYFNSLDSIWYNSNYPTNELLYGRRIFKYILTANDNWEVGGGGAYNLRLSFMGLGISKHFAVSTHFQDISLVNDPSTDSWIQTLGDTISVHFNSSLNINSINDLKNWLTNNEVIVYAIKGSIASYYADPLMLQYPYPLNAYYADLLDAKGYEGGTVVTQENFDRPFDLSAKTIQKVSN